MPSTVLILDSQQVSSAYTRIKHHVSTTPVFTSPALSHIVSSRVHGEKSIGSNDAIQLFFKAENMQKTGSFKFRGALNSIMSLAESSLERGLATTSSGNHAKAVAVAAAEIARTRNISIPVWAVMPDNALESKMRAVEALGATVICSGPSWAQRTEALMRICEKTGATMISSDSNPSVLIGQGTLGIEFAEQMEKDHDTELDCIIAPCGTGGMLGGLALAFQGTATKVYGVEPSAGADDALRGRKLGTRISHVESNSVADGLRSPVSPLAWEIIKDQDLVEDMFSVTDEEIAKALHVAIMELKVIIEPSAAVGLAAVLFNDRLHRALAQYTRPCRVGVVFSGGNVDLARLAGLLDMA